MKDFFIDCLRDLESLTGLRQLYFLQSDLEDGERRKNVLLQGMILAAQDYPYIPEEIQKKVIREQMVKDQNYDALNSRVIHKWLTGVAGKYHTTPKISEEEMTQPAPPEVADQYIKQLQESIAKIGKPEFKNGMSELRRKAGFEASFSAAQPRPKWVVGDVCPVCKGDGIQSGELDDSIEPQPCAKCKGDGIINCAVVNAISQEEADKAYQATFK